MKKFLLFLLTIISTWSSSHAQDTLWVRYDNRFKANDAIDISTADSLEFRANNRTDSIPVYRFFSSRFGKKGYFDFNVPSRTDGLGFSYMFRNPGRIVYQVSSVKNIDFSTDDGQYSFRRSKESEHFVVFWEKGFGNNPKTASNHSFDPDALLASAEHIWDKYVDELGFLVPGKSKTDKYKIIMFVHYSGEWMANGSGEDFMSGELNVTPWAISARGGHTVAHEIGHTFQYLVGCDLGSNHGYNYGYADYPHNGNGWWESCADWQAYKCFPERQFTDGEYFEGNMREHHLNLLHEAFRYENCFIQDWWCDLYGKDFIGRLWRESTKPEDPVQTYQRMNGLTQAQFNDEMATGYMHMATWDIDGVREQARHRIGQEPTHLHKNGDYWEVDSAFCPQNYGYNTINLNNAEAGTTVTAHFKGIAGAKGYRSVNIGQAGWRYGLVAYTREGESVYSALGSNRDGAVSLTVPEGCEKLFFVVMGAPTSHWQHVWDDDVTNDEQWPYQVKFDGTDVYGNFTDYPADYQRKDTTVYVDAELVAANDYSSVSVQYDMGAISQALGLSSDQLRSVGTSRSDTPCFVGVNVNGTYHYGTTTTTSNSSVFGHWFTRGGYVCEYNSSAVIFAEFNRDNYQCKIGQYPGRMVKGNTYTIRQAVRHTIGGKTYTATIVVRLKAV